MAKKIKFIKDCDAGFVGEIKNYSNASADNLINLGYAEYIEEPKKRTTKDLFDEKWKEHQENKKKDKECSYFLNCFAKQPQQSIEISNLFDIIKSEQHKKKIEQIRATKDKDKRSELKKELPCVTIAGEFKGRTPDTILSSAGLTILDIDDYQSDHTTLKEKLRQDTHVFGFFDSPSGGLKILYKIPQTQEAEQYKRYYKELTHKLKELNPNLDSSTCEINRLCYLSYDKNAYYNPEAKEMKLTGEEIEPQNTTPQKKDSKDKDKSRSAKEYGEIIRLLKRGLNKDRVFEEMDKFAKWSTSNENYKETTYNNALASLQKNNNIEKNGFILDENELPQQLDHALGFIIINGKKKRYFGFKINKKIKDRNNKGEQIEKIIKSDVILTEDGELYDYQSCPEKIFFTTRMSIKENRLTLSDINNFLKGNYKKEDFTYRKTFENIKKIYQEKLVFESENWYIFNSLWDIATYHNDMLNKALLIKKEGQSGSAKSKAMGVSCHISFNGRKWLKPTAPNFFRYRNANKSTLYIEEAEKLFDDSKQDTSDKELVEYLNGSYERGNFVPRQNDKRETEEFDPFGFTQIGAIKPLKGALLKRTLIHPMITAKKGDNQNDKEAEMSNEPYYQNVRKLCYLSSLYYWRDYEENLNKIENTFNLANRQWVISKPIIALEKCIDTELSQSIGLFLAEQFDIRDGVSDEKSWYYLLGIIILRTVAEKKDILNSSEKIFFSNQKIRDIFNNDNNKELSSKAVTTQVNQLGFSKFNTRNSERTERGWKCNIFDVLDILWRNNIITLNEVDKNVSEVSKCPKLLDKIKKIYTDTYRTDKDKCPEISDTSDGQDTLFGGSKQKNKEKRINYNPRNLLDVIKFRLVSTKSKMVSTADVSSFGSLPVDSALEKLREYAKKGDVIEIKPDFWGVVE